MSHELRAPLISIKGSADALLEEEAELDRARERARVDAPGIEQPLSAAAVEALQLAYGGRLRTRH